VTDTAALLWGLLVTGLAVLAVLVASRAAPMFGRAPHGQGHGPPDPATHHLARPDRPSPES
jgi:hypothetical protein